MFLRLIFSIFLFTTPAWSMGHLSTSTVDSPLIGKAAPDMILPKTKGKASAVVASRHGQKVILAFWATWCPHCFGGIGTINDNRDAVEQKGIKIILIDEGEAKEDVRHYFERRQMNLVSFVDGDNLMQEAYHLLGVPTLIFIDEKGIIRNVTHEFPVNYEDYFSAR